MVRFLRNATVAKIAGKGSGLLQISGEERERVARVAESFSEEDLTRHLQIMLRTHGELSYKQEQRFHLELGLLKMAHAQRLLPLEQLLSEAAASPASASHATSRQPAAIKNTAAGAVTRHAEPNSPNRAAQASPFAADSARKSGSKPELSADAAPASGPRMVPAPSTARVVMGAAAPANMAEDEPESQSRIPTEFRAQSTPQPQSDSAKLQSAPAGRNSSSSSAQLENVRTAVLQALTNGNQRVLRSMLEAGEWALEGNEVVISVEASATVIDMSLSAEARRLAIASASEVLGRAAKLTIVPGAAIATSGGTQPDAKAQSGKASNGGGRSRAEQDPVVQRMREKFGAQIRTVIDYKEKR
jgi:DNA polymerase-3 subunit gamma/tau